MADALALDLMDKGLVTTQIALTVGYDTECLTNPDIRKLYHGEVKRDHYGREIPKHAHGSRNLTRATSSGRFISDAALELYDSIADRNLLVRRMYVAANFVSSEKEKKENPAYEQISLFDYMDAWDDASQRERKDEETRLQKEKDMQQAILSIRKKYGSNAVFKGLNLEKGATGLERNNQIGGHRA